MHLVWLFFFFTFLFHLSHQKVQRYLFPPPLPRTIHSFVVSVFRSSSSSSSSMFGVYSHALNGHLSVDVPSNVNFMHRGPRYFGLTFVSVGWLLFIELGSGQRSCTRRAAGRTKVGLQRSWLKAVQSSGPNKKQIEPVVQVHCRFLDKQGFFFSSLFFTRTTTYKPQQRDVSRNIELQYPGLPPGGVE